MRKSRSRNTKRTRGRSHRGRVRIESHAARGGGEQKVGTVCWWGEAKVRGADDPGAMLRIG